MSNSEASAIKRCMEALQSNESSAIDTIHHSISEFPNSYVLYFLLGSELAEKDNYSNAKAAFQKALQLHSDFSIARIQLAMLEITNGEFSQLAQILEPLYTSDSEDAYHFFSKAIISVCNDKISEAEDFVVTGIQLNLDNPALNQNMMKMLDIVKSDDDSMTTEQNDSNEESIQSALLDIYNTRVQ